MLLHFIYLYILRSFNFLTLLILDLDSKKIYTAGFPVTSLIKLHELIKHETEIGEYIIVISE